MEDFSVYFAINNQSGSDLKLLRYNLEFALYDGPYLIPKGESQTIRLANHVIETGAKGSLIFMAVINGETRCYQWAGTCPVPIWDNNQASGPGIVTWTGHHGHPTRIDIQIDNETAGFTPWP